MARATAAMPARPVPERGEQSPAHSPAGTALAYIGLGANLGDPVAMFGRVCQALTDLEGTVALRRSRLYRSAPVDASGPDFVNAVVALETTLDPDRLHRELQRLEDHFGRVRGERNAPRLLDLDLLLYGGERIATPALTVPHPRMHQRAFVLLPLAELDPDLVIPGRGPVAELLPGCADQRVEFLEES